MFNSTQTRRRFARSNGVAAVEFAVALPVLVLLTMAAIEASRAVMVQHSLQEAALAACRVYSAEENTIVQAQSIADSALATAGLSGYSVTYTPTSKDQITANLQPVTVQISAPASAVGWFSPVFFQNQQLLGSCTMAADLGDRNTSDGVYDLLDDDHVGDGYVRDDDQDDD